eukprot:TRINITY_DN6881_c0_g1_i5.p1 TRINITY_DN6881_c0_g1~~TRINITY_DN6881_c0_g1_i5.p1  ORF type:complete len:687 (+),score=77.31 TRINITY_DN6881_c0_g1_i5:188-2248(+)
MSNSSDINISDQSQGIGNEETSCATYNYDLDTVSKQEPTYLSDIGTEPSSVDLTGITGYSTPRRDNPETPNQSPRRPLPRKHFREHSYTKMSFDAVFQQFEGRYKTNAYFCPQFGVTKSEVVQYEEMEAPEQKQSFLRKSFSTKKRIEKVGTVQMILHGCCLYLFRQEGITSEDTEGVRAVFVLDHCEFSLVPMEESSEAALDILPGDGHRIRVYLGSAENRGQWLDALQESSPYYSAKLVVEARKEIEQLANQLDSALKELDESDSKIKFLEDSQRAIKQEFETEKQDYEEQIQMLQDEMRIQRQMKSTQQGEFNATVQERDEMEEQLQELATQRDQMREERVALRRRCQKLETQMREIKQAGKDKEKEVKSLSKSLAKQGEAIEKLKRVAENYKTQAKEMSQWRQKAKELENLTQDMDDDINALIEDLEASEQDRAMLEKTVDGLQIEVQRLLKEREGLEMHVRQQSYGGEGNVRTTSSSTRNSMDTIRAGGSQPRRKSDSYLDVPDGMQENVQFYQDMQLTDDIEALQKGLVDNQNTVRQMQAQINAKENQIVTLENRARAFDAFMLQEGSNKKLLEGEVTRLKLKLEEAKRFGVKQVDAPTDPEMLKDPAFHLEFVLQHTSELVMENEKLRAHLAQLKSKQGGVSLKPPVLDQPPTPNFTKNISGQGTPRSHYRKANSPPTV